MFQGELTGDLGITTARDLAEALRSTEAGFREFIDRCPDAVFVRRGDAIIHVNDALLTLLGLRREEVLGKDPVALFVHPSDRDDVLSHRTTAPDGTDLREHRWVRKDGEIVFVEVVGVTVMFEGQPSRICLCRDTTERMRMQARLMVAGRMASVGTLAAGIAHEINNPLSCIISNLRVVAKDPRAAAADPDELREIAEDVLESAERVRRIVEGLRTFTRADAGRRERLELSRVADTAIELAVAELRVRARVARDHQGAAAVEANEGQLVQALVDLLVNAARSIPEGRPDQHEIRVETRCEGSRAVVAIRDTGVGIAPEQLTRVFDPFFSIKGGALGTGLGLSLCHAIVTGLGGDVTVDSRIGKGSLFTVSLPLAATRG